MKKLILSSSAAALTVATMTAAAWCNGSAYEGPFATSTLTSEQQQAMVQQQQAMAEQHRAMSEQHAKAMQQMMEDQRKTAEQWAAQMPTYAQRPPMPEMPAFGQRPPMPEMPGMPAFGQRDRKSVV